MPLQNTQNRPRPYLFGDFFFSNISWCRSTCYLFMFLWLLKSQYWASRALLTYVAVKLFPQWVYVSDLENKVRLIPHLKSWYIISNIFKASFSNLHQRSFIFRSHLTLVMKLHTPPRYSLFKVAQQHQQNNICTNYILLTIWDINTSSSGPSVMFMERLVLSCVSTEGKNSSAWLLRSLEI